jgi:hypothetical protein
MLPPMQSTAAAGFAWAAGMLFAGKIVLNPFHASFNPDEHSWRGPLRVFPVERTLVNDLPMNTDLQRVRILFGQDPDQPRFQLYYLDDNAFFRETDDAFWVRGDARADLIVKVAEPVRTLQLGLQANHMPVRGTVRHGMRSYDYDLQPGETAALEIPLGGGFPYMGTRVWTISISTKGGFLPTQFEPGNTDNRFLGVRVKPVLIR